MYARVMTANCQIYLCMTCQDVVHLRVRSCSSSHLYCTSNIRQELPQVSANSNPCHSLHDDGHLFSQGYLFRHNGKHTTACYRETHISCQLPFSESSDSVQCLCLQEHKHISRSRGPRPHGNHGPLSVHGSCCTSSCCSIT